MRLMARCLACVLLVALPAAGVKPVVVEAGWDEMRSSVNPGDFLPVVRVFTGADGSTRVKARLGRITQSGLELTKNGRPLSIPKGEVHSIRLVPRKATTRKHRQAAAIAAAPVGIGACYGFLVLSCGVWNRCVDPPLTPIILQMAAVAVAAPYLVYRLARRADRGSIIFELD